MSEDTKEDKTPIEDVVKAKKAELEKLEAQIEATNKGVKELKETDPEDQEGGDNLFNERLEKLEAATAELKETISQVQGTKIEVEDKKEDPKNEKPDEKPAEEKYTF